MLHLEALDYSDQLLLGMFGASCVDNDRPYLIEAVANFAKFVRREGTERQLFLLEETVYLRWYGAAVRQIQNICEACTNLNVSQRFCFAHCYLPILSVL